MPAIPAVNCRVERARYINVTSLQRNAKPQILNSHVLHLKKCLDSLSILADMIESALFLAHCGALDCVHTRNQCRQPLGDISGVRDVPMTLLAGHNSDYSGQKKQVDDCHYHRETLSLLHAYSINPDAHIFGHLATGNRRIGVEDCTSFTIHRFLRRFEEHDLASERAKRNTWLVEGSLLPKKASVTSRSCVLSTSMFFWRLLSTLYTPERTSSPGLLFTRKVTRCVGLWTRIKDGSKSCRISTAKVPTLVSSLESSAKMISIASCTIALLLSSAVFAAPAVDPAVTAVISASAAISATPAISVSAAVSPAVSSAAKPTTTKSASHTASAPATGPSGPYIDLDPNGPLWGPDETNPQPIRGDLGATMMGPNDVDTGKNNPDLIAAPSTDHGSVKNAKWPFSLSHNRLEDGGWARQQNVNTMPVATEMASVNMRLEPGAVRELHWHKTAEWAYVLKGKTQVTAVDTEGKNFVATVGPGDLWYFPAGIPHSLQATDDDPEGSEFVLVFDSGDFSEDSTFLLTDWLEHVPAEVLAKNFQTDISAFAHIPAEELFIFPAPLPQPDSAAPKSPMGTVDNPFTFAFSKTKETKFSGGSVKVVDSRTFKASQTIAAAEVTIEPGAIRELHWHPTNDEWSFFIEGHARVTIFAAQSNARTFDYIPGDIGYVPATMGHYVENIGNTTVRFLEIFKSTQFEDISLSNWLALTPPELVKAHLGFDDATIKKLQKTKPVVVGPA